MLCKRRTVWVGRCGHVLYDELRRTFRAYVISASDQDHERGCRTNEKRIDVHRERLHQALLCRVLDFGGSGSVRTRTLPGFIRVDAAFDAPADCSADSGHRRECVADNHADDAGQCTQVHEDDADCEQNVGQRHERYDDLGNVGDTFHTTKDDESEN